MTQAERTQKDCIVVDIDTYLDELENRLPYNLIAKRKVRHRYCWADTLPGALAASKVVMSLGFQMRASVQDLMAELKEQGRDYDLLLEGGYEGSAGGRWNLYVNGKPFAEIDRDYGCDCFDISGTQFKSNIAALIDQAEAHSTIRPLSTQERSDMDVRIAAAPVEWGRSQTLQESRRA